MLGRVLALAALAALGCRDEGKGKGNGGGAPEGPPARIITLTPSATGLVAALGAAERLVATDRYSEEPEAVKRLPKVGDFLAPNVEAIAKLRPDLVVMDAVQAKAAASLADLGLATVSIEMHTIADVRAAALQVGRALGAEERGQRVSAEIDRALAAAAARAERRERRPRVLWVMDRQPGSLSGIVVAGPGSFADELLAAVGARNAITGSVRYPKVSRESLIELSPDVIIDASGPAERSIEPWDRIEVGPERPWRVEAASVQLATPGPGVTASLETVERLVFPGTDPGRRP